MKQHCIALAAGLATLGAAHAQSQVTIFGVIDTAISRYQVTGGARMTEMDTDGIQSSRIGFRGTEDLGGGMRATFWIEGALAGDTGSPAFTFERRATVGLIGRWGEVRLGRDYTPTYNVQSDFSGPWVTNGVGESMVYRARANFYGNSNAGQSTHVRASNAINYLLPRSLGNLSGQVMFALGEATNHSDTGDYMGARLNYRMGAFTIGGAYSKTEGGLTQPTSRPRDIVSSSLGMSYETRAFTLQGLYADDRVRMPLREKRLKGYNVGLTVPVGSGEFRASTGRASTSYPGSSFKVRKYAIGYVHHLSRRTALYVTHGRLNNDNGGSFTVGGTPAGVVNRASTGQNFGIRHTF